MKNLIDSSYLTGINQPYISQLYEDFLTDPNSVDSSWSIFFKQLSNTEVSSTNPHSKTWKAFHQFDRDTAYYISLSKDQSINSKQGKVLQLIHSFRFFGYQHANLDPLGIWQNKTVPDLNPVFYDFTETDLQETFHIGSFATNRDTMKLTDLYDQLKTIYCGTIGTEYMHITSSNEKCWIQQRIESTIGQPSFSYEEKKRLLSELTAAEGIEHYLRNKFPGAKRFSLEGGDALIPMLKEILRYAGNNGTKEIILGMAHRGRLNVLINVLGKKPRDLFDEFSDKYQGVAGSGDVKYHQGFSSNIETEGGLVSLSLMFNPSHLEIISPVVIGSVRARIDQLNELNSIMILPIILHGDAAISGQGVVQETFNMSKVRGYDVGGTVHIVINNQLGFTTSNPHDIRSTQYCTDIAKMVQVPIFHVNADDPEAVIVVARIALEFRNTFKRDVIIDLVCYRRHGHNEVDEPSATQPLMYRKINNHPTSREIYVNRLRCDGVVTLADAMKMVNTFRKALDQGECMVKELRQVNMQSSAWQYYPHNNCFNNYLNKVESKRLQDLAYRISKVPDNFEMQPLVAKIYNDRAAMARGEKPFDWGGAEILAYATLVDRNISIRLSGEDTKRGTFFHRHAVVHDQKNGTTYIPLAHIHSNQGTFSVWDSVLSEEATLAFEYGYATTESRTLVIWEAQFGDFANGAQVVIDQFISAGEQKWGQMCCLVMLLPHGYEGQGPEHSSARLERYLQLCAEQNMQVCVPSTPSQIYHILRRQALLNIRRPLIIMSPKSLLHHPMAISLFDELVNGTFQSVIGEIDRFDPHDVKRVIMCSGKVYYDLLSQRRRNRQNNVAIIRIEQLYPFPIQAVNEVLTSYEHVQDFVWCQEEPQNQGAWYYSQNYLSTVISTRNLIHYVGRPASASPAVGNWLIHQIQQKNLVSDALNVN